MSLRNESDFHAKSRGSVSVTIGGLLAAMLLLSPVASMAMARIPVQLPPSEVEEQPIPGDTGSGESGERVDAGRYGDGYRMGERAADALVSNLLEKTVHREGCDSLPRFEAALVAVTRSLKPPVNAAANVAPVTAAQDPLVRGYFRGYLDGIRAGNKEGRAACAVTVHESGRFAGDLYGTYLCRSGEVSLEWVREMDLESLYEGWSGGRSVVFGECEEAVIEQLRACGLGEYSEVWSRVIESSCWAD